MRNIVVNLSGFKTVEARKAILEEVSSRLKAIEYYPRLYTATVTGSEWGFVVSDKGWFTIIRDIATFDINLYDVAQMTITQFVGELIKAETEEQTYEVTVWESQSCTVRVRAKNKEEAENKVIKDFPDYTSDWEYEDSGVRNVELVR